MLNSGRPSGDTSSHAKYGSEPFEGQTSYSDATCPLRFVSRGRGRAAQRPVSRWSAGAAARIASAATSAGFRLARLLPRADPPRPADGNEETGNGPAMRVGWQDWQRLLRLEMELAVSMKKVADPDALRTHSSGVSPFPQSNSTRGFARTFSARFDEPVFPTLPEESVVVLQRGFTRSLVLLPISHLVEC